MDEKRETRKKGGAAAALIVTVMLLLGLYVASYYTLVTPVTYVDESRHGTPFGVHVEPVFPWGGLGLEVAFCPANWLDRRLRPDVWEPQLEAIP